MRLPCHAVAPATAPTPSGGVDFLTPPDVCTTDASGGKLCTLVTLDTESAATCYDIGTFLAAVLPATSGEPQPSSLRPVIVRRTSHLPTGHW